jgi:hypothetical protein
VSTSDVIFGRSRKKLLELLHQVIDVFFTKTYDGSVVDNDIAEKSISFLVLVFTSLAP